MTIMNYLLSLLFNQLLWGQCFLFLFWNMLVLFLKFQGWVFLRKQWFIFYLISDKLSQLTGTEERNTIRLKAFLLIDWKIRLLLNKSNCIPYYKICTNLCQLISIYCMSLNSKKDSKIWNYKGKKNRIIFVWRRKMG